MDTVSIMGRSAVYEYGNRSLLGQKRGDHVVQETPAEFACTNPLALDFDPPTLAGAIERGLDVDQWDARACIKIRQRKSRVQAQRIEHELERQLFRRDDVIAADNSRGPCVFKV